MGEFLFLDNKPAEGEKVLAELISSLPHKAIGYACMAEMFSDSKFNAGQDNPLDLAQAIGYLERCLAFPAEDAADFDIEKRLAALKGEA